LNSPNPALVSQREAEPLPRVALLVLCAAYVLPGLVGRDPWKSADITLFGYSVNIAGGRTGWLAPTVGGVPADGALLPYWIGAAFVRMLSPLVDPIVAARVPFALLLALALSFTWYAAYHLARSKSAQPLPGRKVVFLLSGGFFIENQRADTRTRLRSITNAAAKSGVVIYSMDTRGLVATLQDASYEGAFDVNGQLARATHGEISASQDGMNALAVDTGGKALFNTNDLVQGLAPAIKETSTYYLLAWKPDAEAQKQKRFRQLEVKLVGRPDLTVRVRKGFFDVDPPSATAAAEKDKKAAEQAGPNKTVPAKLRQTIGAAYPQRDLPILMSVDYYDVPEKGPTVSTAIQLPGEFLSFGEQPNGKIQATIDLTGVYFDEKGNPKASFLERIVTTAPSAEAAQSYHTDITYTYPATLPPGLYQVRAAARDDKSGRVGSVHSWIEIPDLSKKQLSMSSILLGERTQAQVANVSDSGQVNPVSLSASHRFKRASTLRFLIFAYNTTFAPTDHKPDIAVQVQVIRDDQPVLTTALRKIATEGVADLARIPYAAEIPMSDLQPGRYLLQISVIDRVAKQSTIRQTHFDVY